MRIISTALVFVWIWFLAAPVYGGETVAPFVKKSLGIDLATLPMGQIVETKGTFGPTAPLGSALLPLQDEKQVSWMTNSVSVKYTHDFPNRNLVFGFRNGRMVAIRISISAYSAWTNPGSDPGKQARAELVQIQSDLGKAGPGNKFDFGDDHFDIKYSATCSPRPDDLGFCIYQIATMDKNK